MVKKTKLIISFFLSFLITIYPLLIINNINNIKVGFSPKGFSKEIILMAIREAKKTIDIAAYSFTSKPIALALINAKKKGILIRIVADKKANSKKYTAITYLRNKHILIKLNGKYSIMHNKFIIIDNKSIETGSFNYTNNAALNNAENVIYLRNRPDIALQYTKEFNKLWNEKK